MQALIGYRLFVNQVQYATCMIEKIVCLEIAIELKAVKIKY